jgi:hypothetical protein
MHLVNILRIIMFSCLEGHSNFNNSDFNSFLCSFETNFLLALIAIDLFHLYIKWNWETKNNKLEKLSSELIL